MKVHEKVLLALESGGDRPAVLEVNANSSFRAATAGGLMTSIRETAAFFRSAGIRQGMPVAVFLENSIEFIQTLFALCSIGAIPSTQKLECRSFELKEIFSNLRPGAVIAESEHVEVLRSFLEARQTIIARHGDRFRVVQWGDETKVPTEPDEEVSSINYTYRGYGYPVGVEVTHSQYLHGAAVLQEGLQGLAGESMLFNLPMTHILTLVGCILVPLIYGMTSVIARTFHPRHIYEAVQKHRVNYITAVPEILLLLQRVKGPDLVFPSLRAFISGGSRLLTKDYEKIRQAFKVEVLHGYGLTEFAPVSRNIRNQARAGTIGPVCDGIEARIDTPDGTGAGEILLRSSYLSRRYHRRPRETQSAFHEGWFLTGDLGRYDAGHLVFIREKKATCKINGVMVDLEEVRRAILLDREVEAAEVGLEDGTLTARLALKNGTELQRKRQDLSSFLKTIISAYKIPKRIVEMT